MTIYHQLDSFASGPLENFPLVDNLFEPHLAASVVVVVAVVVVVLAEGPPFGGGPLAVAAVARIARSWRVRIIVWSCLEILFL